MTKRMDYFWRSGIPPHLRLIHLHAKTSTPSLTFPQSSIFHVGFLCRAFCPVSSLMGITHKPLSFWTALWPALSGVWLSSQADSQIECRTGSQRCRTVPALSSAFSSTPKLLLSSHDSSHLLGSSCFILFIYFFNLFNYFICFLHWQPPTYVCVQVSSRAASN